MNRRRLSPRLRIQFVGLLMILGMAALGLRLWWIQVAHGTLQVNGHSVNQGDGVRLSNERLLQLASDDEAEVLVFDLA